MGNFRHRHTTISAYNLIYETIAEGRSQEPVSCPRQFVSGARHAISLGCFSGCIHARFWPGGRNRDRDFALTSEICRAAIERNSHRKMRTCIRGERTQTNNLNRACQRDDGVKRSSAEFFNLNNNNKQAGIIFCACFRSSSSLVGAVVVVVVVVVAKASRTRRELGRGRRRWRESSWRRLQASERMDRNIGQLKQCNNAASLLGKLASWSCAQ